ncbi:hypothetical protein KFK09_021431 [Dendrobium nobile]|uniref:Uncharacterized protein n=1 Tax=Dendrobium nobile TaxID=94219 RepID=A0A8T3APZ4_DENNO|nr:hypothetical protein KFK09_021431 [Dendrobium nobile]
MADRIIAVIVSKIIDALIYTFNNIQSENARAASVEKDIDELSSRAEMVRAILCDADRRGSSSNAVEDNEKILLWLRDQELLVVDVEDLREEFKTLAVLASSDLENKRKRKRSWNPLSALQRPDLRDSRAMVQRIDEIRKNFDAIRRDRQYLELDIGENWRVRARKHRPSSVTGFIRNEQIVYGRDTEREEIIRLLICSGGDGVPVISIVGIGGIGKTTLAQAIFRNPRVESYFDLKIWVYLGLGVDAAGVMTEIIRAVTRKNVNISNFDLMQSRLTDILLGKRFLLVLDDVWNEELFFWDNLLAPLNCGALGSKVLVTTRSETVSRMMRALRQLRLDALKDEECWLLFRDQALRHLTSSDVEKLEDIGRQIVRRCQDSPFALKKVAGVLHPAASEDELRIALNALKDIEKDEFKILSALIVSYEHLPLHLKHCFAYCSIFPHGYEFDRDRLVLQWIAVGFIQADGRRRVEDIGYGYFNDLMWSLFFDAFGGYGKAENIYKIPGAIHDLASYVSRHKCLRVDFHGVLHGEFEKALYASLNQHNMEPKTLEKVYKNSRLRALVIHGEDRVALEQVPCDLFKKLKCLRVLNLSSTELKELPDSVCDLIHLKYLDLSNTQLKILPDSMCKLYNLQTLELSECYKLLELPKEFCNLVNLRHLGLQLDWEFMGRRVDLISMPPGLGRLKSLQTLSRFVVSSDIGCSIGELKNLNLHGDLRISKLEKVINLRHAEEADLKSKQYIDRLILQWSCDSGFNEQYSLGYQENVLEHLRPHPKLKSLWIENYDGRKLPDWLDNPSLCRLQNLRLSNCRGCEHLPRLGLLPALKNLHLEAIHRVKNMGDFVAFPLLEVFTLQDMPSMERLFETANCTIPRLSELFISNCPNLLELPPAIINSLPKLEIRNCPRLSNHYRVDP